MVMARRVRLEGPRTCSRCCAGRAVAVCRSAGTASSSIVVIWQCALRKSGLALPRAVRAETVEGEGQRLIGDAPDNGQSGDVHVGRVWNTHKTTEAAPGEREDDTGFTESIVMAVFVLKPQPSEGSTVCPENRSVSPMDQRRVPWEAQHQAAAQIPVWELGRISQVDLPFDNQYDLESDYPDTSVNQERLSWM